MDILCSISEHLVLPWFLVSRECWEMLLRKKVFVKKKKKKKKIKGKKERYLKLNQLTKCYYKSFLLLLAGFSK